MIQINSKQISTKLIKYIPSKEKELYGKFIIEDNDNFIVINKPSGISVQAERNHLKILLIY